MPTLIKIRVGISIFTKNYFFVVPGIELINNLSTGILVALFKRATLSKYVFVPSFETVPSEESFDTVSSVLIASLIFKFAYGCIFF